jgi:Holliday junction resolvase
VAQTPEKKVKNKVVEILKAHGAYYFFPATFGMGRSGVPDIVCCYKGSFLAIECKAGKGKTTPLQDREIEAIGAAGGMAMIVNEDTMREVVVALNILNRMGRDKLSSSAVAPDAKTKTSAKN